MNTMFDTILCVKTKPESLATYHEREEGRGGERESSQLLGFCVFNEPTMGLHRVTFYIHGCKKTPPTTTTGQIATEIHFLSARDHADELSLTRGENEDRSKSQFP